MHVHYLRLLLLLLPFTSFAQSRPIDVKSEVIRQGDNRSVRMSAVSRHPYRMVFRLEIKAARGVANG